MRLTIEPFIKRATSEEEETAKRFRGLKELVSPKEGGVPESLSLSELGKKAAEKGDYEPLLKEPLTDIIKEREGDDLIIAGDADDLEGEEESDDSDDDEVSETDTDTKEIETTNVTDLEKVESLPPKPPPPGDVDTSVIEGRSDKRILEDAEKIALELHRFSEQAEKDAIQKQTEIQEILMGQEGNNLKAAMEKASKNITEKTHQDKQSLFDEIVDPILETITNWTIVIGEKKKQGRLYGEILRKLKHPQFRLPAWLDALATGTSVERVKEQRQKRYDRALDVFLDTKLPMSNMQKRDFNKLMQGHLDRVQANENVVKQFFGRQEATAFLKEYAKPNSPLKQIIDNVLIKMLINNEDRELISGEIPQEVKERAKRELEKQIQKFESTNRSLELDSGVLGLFIDHFIDNRGPALRQLKEAIGQKAAAANVKIRNFVRIAQEGASSEKITEEQQALIKEHIERLDSIIRESIGVQETTGEEDEKKTSILNSYARVTSLFFDKNFAPSLGALGHKWMEEHPEGSRTGYAIVETTREGDGEKLLTVFDPQTGIGSRAVKMIKDYVYYAAIPTLDEAVFRLENLVGIENSERQERLFGTDSTGDGISDTQQVSSFNSLIEDWIKINSEHVEGMKKGLDRSAKAVVTNAIARGYESFKGYEEKTLDNYQTLIQKNLNQIGVLEEISEERDISLYKSYVTSEVHTMNTFLEIQFRSPFEEPVTESEAEPDTEPEADTEPAEETPLEAFIKVVQRQIPQLEQSVESFATHKVGQEKPLKVNVAERSKAMSAFFEALRPIKKRLDQFFAEAPPNRESLLKAFTRTSAIVERPRYDVFGRVGGYVSILQKLKDKIEILRHESEDVLKTREHLSELREILDHKNLINSLRIIEGNSFDLYDPESFMKHYEEIVVDAFPELKSSLEESEQQEEALKKVKETAFDLSAQVKAVIKEVSKKVPTIVKQEPSSNNILVIAKNLAKASFFRGVGRLTTVILNLNKLEEITAKLRDYIEAAERAAERIAPLPSSSFPSELHINRALEHPELRPSFIRAIKLGIEFASKSMLGEGETSINELEEIGKKLAEQRSEIIKEIFWGERQEQEEEGVEGKTLQSEASLGQQVSALLKKKKSRIDVNRANRLIALRKIQRAVINL